MTAHRPTLRRRDFLALAGGVATTAALGKQLIRPAAAASARPVGIQLYTVMPMLSRDFEGTIKALAEIGYQEVETIGSFGRDPREVRAIFDKYALASPSQHIASKELYAVFDLWVKRQIAQQDRDRAFLKAFDLARIDDTIGAAIESAHALGQKYIIWQALFESQVGSPQAVDRLLRAFNRAGDLCHRAGLTFGFHNHAFELTKAAGGSIYDRILKGSDPERLKLEIDFYWMKKAGADAAAYLHDNPGRYRLCHLKDMDPRGEIIAPGSGTMVTRELIELAQGAGIEHFFVENDSSAIPLSPESHAYHYLRELL
jgi:sugar phosphate isomerase/epimerase